MIEQQTCFLTLCDRTFSKKAAFSFLEDLATEFHNQYGHKINTATRPYSFIEFDTYIQKAKKTYGDSRGRRHLANLNSELQDVQRIMVQNIEDVLQRGAILSELENKSANLTEMSRKYKKDAETLNATSLAVIAGENTGSFPIMVPPLYNGSSSLLWFLPLLLVPPPYNGSASFYWFLLSIMVPPPYNGSPSL